MPALVRTQAQLSDFKLVIKRPRKGVYRTAGAPAREDVSSWLRLVVKGCGDDAVAASRRRQIAALGSEDPVFRDWLALGLVRGCGHAESVGWHAAAVHPPSPAATAAFAVDAADAADAGTSIAGGGAKRIKLTRLGAVMCDASGSPSPIRRPPAPAPAPRRRRHGRRPPSRARPPRSTSRRPRPRNSART